LVCKSIQAAAALVDSLMSSSWRISKEFCWQVAKSEGAEIAVIADEMSISAQNPQGKA
jgi:hypothetical protein